MKNNKWFYLILLSLIWGSSFILMKKALIGLNPIEIGAFRILIAGVILLFIGIKRLKSIEKKLWKPLAIVAFIGTFFPVFLFSYAISEIDSGIAAVLNSLTPIITMLLGAFFFNFSFTKKQVTGIVLGLFGTLILLYRSAIENPSKEYQYAFLILIAACGYGFSVNFLKRKLSTIDSLSITTATFTMLLLPAMIVLIFSGFFNNEFSAETLYTSLGYVFLLAAFGTSMAMLLFYRLVQISSPVFSTSVTYLITVVAVIWGVLDGEKISAIQFLASIGIIAGVIMAQRK